MACDWWNPFTYPECVEDVVVGMFKAIIDGIVGFFTLIIDSIAYGVVFLITSLEAGVRYMFDVILAAMEWMLGQFGIATPILMGLATAFFILIAGATIYVLLWTSMRLYELL